MDLRKHRQRPPAPAGSREILLDITKNFINPSHLLFKKEDQAGTKEGAEEEEEEEEEDDDDDEEEAAEPAKEGSKAMTKVCASSHVLCRNGSNDAEPQESPPCRRRSSIKDADELCHGRPPLSLAMDSPVFAPRSEALRFHSTNNNINQIAVPSDSHEAFLESQQMVRSERRKPASDQKPGSGPKLGLNQKVISDPNVGFNQKAIPDPIVSKVISEPKMGLYQKVISEPKVGFKQKVIPELKVVIPGPKVGLNQMVISEPKLGFNQNVIPESKLVISDPKVGSNQKAIADSKVGSDKKLVLPLHESKRVVLDPEAVSSLHSETHQAKSNNEEEDSDREVVGSEAFQEQSKGEESTISRDVVLGNEIVASAPEAGEANHHRSTNRSPKLRQNEEDVELSVVAFVFDALRRSGLSCKGSPDDIKMDIGRPTDVRHIAHVTFDRFNGFLGLPAEFQMQIPRIAPSASVSAFGVSAQSMQCSYDRRGNSVPTILLLLQERLYDKKGLRAEGIFRINAENSQEEHVRSQLNHGIVPHDVDVHCLAGMIKAWFRELPRGVLDSLSPDQVMQCNSEDQAVSLMKTLPPMERGLLDWGINLMADVVHEEAYNKMNAHNIAMVFAPNMTQVSDPLIALMHAVQVMNLLKMLILRTLRDRNGGYRVTQGSDSVSSSFRRRDNGKDGYEPSHESKERSARRILPKYEYEYFVDRQGSALNAASSKSMAENTTVAKLQGS